MRSQVAALGRVMSTSSMGGGARPASSPSPVWGTASRAMTGGGFEDPTARLAGRRGREREGSRGCRRRSLYSSEGLTVDDKAYDEASRGEPRGLRTTCGESVTFFATALHSWSARTAPPYALLTLAGDEDSARGPGAIGTT